MTIRYGTWYCPACDRRVTNNALGREAHRRSPSHRAAVVDRRRLKDHQQPKVSSNHGIPEVLIDEPEGGGQSVASIPPMT